MANLVSWFDDPFKKKREQNQAQTNSSTNPFQQVGNWLSKGGFVGDIARNVFGQNQNQSQVKTVATNSFNTANRNQGINKLNTGLRTFNNNFGSTNTLNKLNTLNSSQERQKSMPNFTTQNSIGGANVTSEQGEPKLATVNNTSTDGLTTLKSGLGTNNSLQNFEQKVNNYRQQQQNEADQKQQLLNQRADQARNFYDNDFKTTGQRNQNAINTVTSKYKNAFGQSVLDREGAYENRIFDKLTRDDGTMPGTSEELINKYRSLSNDDKWDVWQNIQNAKNTYLQGIGTADDNGDTASKNAYGVLLSQITNYEDMLAPEDRGEKSFGKQIGDYFSSGGPVAAMAGPVTNLLGNLSEAVGNKGGAETSRAIQQNRAINREGNSGVFDAIDFLGDTTANIAANTMTGGAYGLVNSGANLIDSIASAANDRNRNYYVDNEGNLTRENQSLNSKIAGVGNAALGLGLTAAGMKGFGPNIRFNNAGQTLQSAIANKEWGDLAKTMGKYAMKEVPFALGQTALQQGISAAGGDQNFGDNFGQQLAGNIVGDLAVDLTGALRQGRGNSRNLFERGPENDQSALQRLANLGEKIPVGSTIKPGAAPDGSDLVVNDKNPLKGVPSNSKAQASTARNYLKENLQGQRIPLNYGQDGEALISKQGIDKVTTTGGINSRGKLLGNLDEILKVSKANPNEPIRPDNGNHAIAKDGFEYRQAWVDDGDETYRVRPNIGIADGEKTFYTLNRYNDSANENSPAQIGKSLKESYGEVSSNSIARNGKKVNIPVLENVNPTGKVFTEYDPVSRTGQISSKLVPYSETAQIKPSDEVTVYRGVPKGAQKTLNAGDFITTNKQLAKDYAGDGDVISQKVPAGTILDDSTEPLGEEYIYRPDLLDGNSGKQQNSPDRRSILERIADFGDKHGAMTVKDVSSDGSRDNAINNMRGTDIDVPSRQQMMNGQMNLLDQAPNPRQQAIDNIQGKEFSQLSPKEQATWLDVHSDQVMTKTQLANEMKAIGINPKNMSRLDMLREYAKMQDDARTPSGASNTVEDTLRPLDTNNKNTIENKSFSELSPKNQEAWFKQHENQIMSKAQLQSELKDMGVDTKNMSKFEMFKEYSKQTAPQIQMDDDWVRQPSKNSTEVASVRDVVNGDSADNKRKFTVLLKGVNNRVANVVRKAIGVDVRSYDHTVDNYATKHALNEHQNDAIPLKSEDFNKISDIIKNPDKVYWDDGANNVGKNSKGESKQRNGVIKYEKQYGDRIVYLEEVRNSSRELAMKTMYWQEAPKNSTTDLANSHPELDTNSLRALPRQGEGATTNSVSQNTENVNGNASATEFDTKAYVKQQVAAQKQQSKTPLKQRAANAIDDIKHYLVDDAVAYQRYVKDKGARQLIDNGVDRVRASDTIAKQMIEDSGLAETIGKMKTEDADEFQQYLIAKRGQELKRQKGADFKTGRDDVADQALIKSVGNKYAAQEKVVRDFNKMMLDYSVETGLISKALRDKLVKDSTDYVPMNRVMDDIEGMGMHKSKQLANLSKQTAVQKIKGSDRVVQNPLESMIKNAVRIVNEGERNKTAKYLADTAAFREARMPEGAKARPGYDTLSFLQDGKQVKYEVPELVAKEMKNLNSVMGDNAQKIVNILSTPARLLRAGATGDNPMFAASNLIRDQLQTVVTGNLKANIKGTPKAIVAAFAPGQKGKALRAELARAGVTGTEYRQTYGYKPGELVKELQAGHQMPKQAWERLKHPIDTIADLIGRTEYFTRAQQYFGTEGTPEQKALAARNNTLNFGRGGSAVRVLNKMIPFLNAGVQGGRITVKQFKERPIRTTGAIAATIGIAAAARAINSSINQDLYDRLGDEEKKNNLVLFTEDAKYDPETNRVTGVVKVPMPQMLYPVLDAVNNIEGKPEDLLTMAGDIFTAFTGLESPDANASTIGESVLPMVNQLTPTAIKPFLETAMNKNTYTGQEIVSEYDTNKNPEDKGAKYTTDAARKLAKITGVDAPVIDNFINNWGGGVTKDLVKVLGDNPDNKKDGGGLGKIFDEGAFRRFASGSVESQYEIAEGIAKNYKNEVKSNDAFKNLSANDQEKVLNAIDTDMNKIASISAKVEQNRGEEIGDNGLSKRQTEIMNNGFNAGNYITAVLDKKQQYQGNDSDKSSNGGDFATLSGNALDYGKSSTTRNNPLEINDSLNQTYKDTLNTYNSMSSDDWEKYTYQPANRDAEYKLALAKYENDNANGDLTDVDKVKRQKELRKLEVSQQWDKSTRDAYGLAGNRADMQNFLNNIENRDDMVGYLNAMNRAMYDAGVITASTYKTRNRNINNLESSRSSSKKKSGSSGLSNAAKSALSAYTKALTSGNSIKVNKTPSAPSTGRRMASTSLKSTSLKKYTPGNPTITVKKGIK